MEKIYDTLVIGIGPAGISASVYLKRFGRDVIAVGKDRGILEKPALIENYYGYMPTNGADIVDNGIKQAINVGVQVCKDEVISVEYNDSTSFKIKTKKNEYLAKTILIATGKQRTTLKFASKYEGKGVSYCATCDGFFYRGKKLAIIGNTSYMKHELDVLNNIANEVVVFTDNKELEMDIENKVIKEKITNFIGEDEFKGIKTENNEYLFDGCFIALGSLGAEGLSKHLGLELDNNKNIKVNENKMTLIKGIFAAGDVIGGMPQIVKAAHDGYEAALNINKYLKELK